MKVLNLEEMSSVFARLVNAGDLDSLCSLYASDAAFSTGQGSDLVSGPAAIREVLTGFLASKPVMEFEHVYVLENGDTAVARGAWKLTSRAADGSSSVMTGNSVEVLRRQADGSWVYFIDHPWGADAR